MNHLLPTFGVVLLSAFGLCREGHAQTPADKALQRARVIEEQEGDLRAAEGAYRALIDDTGTVAGVRNDAMLRLGRMWWRLGREGEAKTMLQRVQQAGGDVGAAAAAILQGQGPEAQAAALVAERARDAIARLIGEKPGTGNADQDLRWLGVAAIPEALRQLGDRRARAVEALRHLAAIDSDTTFYRSALGISGEVTSTDATVNMSLQAVRAARIVAQIVWRAGGEEAQRYLRAAIADEDVRWRRVIASASTQAADELLPLVTQMLKDGDPEGTVTVMALQSAGRLPLDAVVATLGSPIAAVRASAWSAVAWLDLWSGSSQSPKEEALRLLEPHLVKALGDPDPGTGRTAFAFLRSKAASAERGVELLLEWLPRVPVFQDTGGSTVIPRLASVARAARALGPFGTADGKDERRRFLARLADQAVRNDRTRVVANICDLVELGYDQAQANHWLAQAAREARADGDLVRIVSLLDRCLRPEDVEQTLAGREGDLPAATLPGLRQRLQGILPRTREPTKERPFSEVEVRDWQEANWLFQAIGRTRSPEAITFLRQQLGERSFWSSAITDAALLLSERSQATEVVTFLRELLVSEAVREPEQRNGVFGELARRGDAGAIPLYPKSYGLGLDASGVEGVRMKVRGAQWLAMLPAGTSQQGQSLAKPLAKLHGYDDASLEQAWQTLLHSAAMPEVLLDVAVLVWISSGGDVADGVRLQMVELLSGRLPELLAHFNETPVPGEGGYGPRRRIVLSGLLEWVARRTPATQDAASQRYRSAIQKLLANDEVGVLVATMIAWEAMPLLADAVRPLLAGPKSLEVMQALRQAGVTLTTADLVACLRSQSDNRAQFLSWLPPDMPPEIVREVEKMVRDPDAAVRALACAALGRTLSPDAVAALLPALRDPSGNVSKEANAALQAIRHYQEQRAFWDQFQQGVTTGKENATAKLLIQSKPGGNKEQRLLALRSLGALGAPEALPYLIDWSQEQDADVAAACKAAIARIHQQAGIK